MKLENTSKWQTVKTPGSSALDSSVQKMYILRQRRSLRYHPRFLFKSSPLPNTLLPGSIHKPEVPCPCGSFPTGVFTRFQIAIDSALKGRPYSHEAASKVIRSGNRQNDEIIPRLDSRGRKAVQRAVMGPHRGGSPRRSLDG